MKHSRMGVASFVLSVGAWILLFSVRNVDPNVHPSVILIQDFTYGANFVAFGLGISSLARSEDKQAFAVLGTFFSTPFAVLSVVLMIKLAINIVYF